MDRRRAMLSLAVVALLAFDGPMPAAEALRESLLADSRNALALTSRRDGFLTNPEIRIALPGAMKDMARGLRRIGFASHLQEFELALNRAAEAASGEALDVFAGAIEGLDFSGVRPSKAAGTSAVAEYLRSAAFDELRDHLAPIAERSMAKAGVRAIYARMLQHWKAMPGAVAPDLDLDEYLTQETLDGLLRMIAREESRRLRSDPAAG